MTLEEKETLNKFVNVNESFLLAIKNNDLKDLDLVLKLEIALFYFKINQEDVLNLEPEDKELILSLIESNNFVLIGNHIKWNNKLIEIEYILSLVFKVEDIKKSFEVDKVIKVDFRPQNEDSIPDYPCQVIDLSEAQKTSYYTSKEREFLLEKSGILDSDTLPFVTANQANFECNMNVLILELISGEDISADYIYLLLLAYYLRLYPFGKYLENKYDITYEKLDIPQNEIGLLKFKIKDEFVRKLDKAIGYLSREKESLIRQRRFFRNIKNAEHFSLRSTIKINEIDSKIFDFSYSYFIHAHDSAVYNEVLIRYIIRAFEQGNIYWSGICNPVIKMFVIEDSELNFFGAMHLNILDRCTSFEAVPFEEQKEKLFYKA